MRKALLLALSLIIASHIYAVDVVTLKNNNILYGNITNKEADGSLYITLTDGSKRYVMGSDILSVKVIEDAELPEKEAVAYSQNLNEREYSKFNITAYIGYSQNLPTNTTIFDNKYRIVKPGYGFMVGAAMEIPVSERLVFYPGLEFSYNTFSTKSEINLVEYDCPNYTSRTLDMDSNAEHELRFRLPIQFGFDVLKKDNLYLRLITGPVLDAAIYVGDSKAKRGRVNFSFIEELEPNYYHRYEQYGYLENRWFNIDWRVGAEVGFGKFAVGVGCDFGLLNAISSDTLDGFYSGSNPSMRNSALHVKFGMKF